MGAAGFVLFCFCCSPLRLSTCRSCGTRTSTLQAENNRIAVVPIVPNRGLILDRNGVVLATNYSAYTLEITPSKVGDLEATIDELATSSRSSRATAAASRSCSKKQELRVAADPHQAHRRGSGALHRAALPLPRRRDQGAPVPHYPWGEMAAT
jgi:cell division protein FtsI/penicillin-binding protein 2